MGKANGQNGRKYQSVVTAKPYPLDGVSTKVEMVVLPMRTSPDRKRKGGETREGPCGRGTEVVSLNATTQDGV